MDKTVSQIHLFYSTFITQHAQELDQYSSTAISHHPTLHKLVSLFVKQFTSSVHTMDGATVMEEYKLSNNHQRVYKIFWNQSYYFILTRTECKPFECISFEVETIFPFYYPSFSEKSKIPLLLQVHSIKASSEISLVQKCNKCNSIALKDEMYCSIHKYEKLQEHLSNRMELQGMNYFKSQYETVEEKEYAKQCWYFVNQKWVTLCSQSEKRATLKKRKRTTDNNNTTVITSHRYLQEQNRINAQEYLRKIVKVKQKKDGGVSSSTLEQKEPNLQLFTSGNTIGTVEI